MKIQLQIRSLAGVRLVAHGLLLMAVSALAQLADPYAEARQYKSGESNAALLAIEADIRAASAEQRRVIEAGLIQIVQSPTATLEARGWACRTLRMAGSEQAVPALSAVLADAQLGSDALFALRSIAGPKVNGALREALPKTQGLVKAGVIQTLGARGDRQSVALLAPLAGETDPAVAEAALYALGHIGGREALRAAQSARVPDRLQRYRQHAVLLCAESVLAEGKNAEAAFAYHALYTRSKDTIIKSGALRGLVLAEQAKAAPVLIDALTAQDSRLRAAAAKFLCEVAGDDLVQAALGQWPSFYPETQAMILGMIAHPAALATARGALQSGNEDVRVAALGAVGRMGEATSVPPLLAAAAEKGSVQAAARKSLQFLSGPGVNEALILAAKSGAVEVRSEALLALTSRNAVAAVPALFELAGAEDLTLRTEVWNALGQLAGLKDLSTIVQQLGQSRAGRDREAAERAVASVMQRVADKEVAAVPLVDALGGAPSEVRCALLRVLAQEPSARSLKALRAAAKDADPAVKDAAVRGLAEWPDAGAMPDLLALARSAESKTHRALALRGVTRLAAAPGPSTPEERAQVLGEALGLSGSADEKKAVLAALGGLDQASAVDLAAGCLSDPDLEVAAATAVVRLARKLQRTDAEAASAAVQKVLDTCKSPAARQLAESAGVALKDTINIAPQGTVSSPDDLDKDGAASGDQAAIDGNPDTYWDEADGAKVYRLVVTFKRPEKIAALSITGYGHHNYAPKDFGVLCNGQLVKTVENAQYSDNFLVVPLPETSCQQVELKITGYHGASPAIRELGIYRPTARKKAEFSVLVFSRTLGFRHANIPLGVAAIRQLGAAHGFSVDATEDSAVFTGGNLDRYKAVVFLSVTGDVLNGEQEQAFKEYVLGGGGFAAIHGALYGPSACEEQWAWYGELCCASFKNHSAVVPGRVDVEDRQNPSTVHLPERWIRTDEWYNYAASPRGCARVLATVDEATYQGGTLGADHPISWCRRMGQGRVWCTAMGHTEASFAESLFLRHVLGGIELVSGTKDSEWVPNQKPPAAAGPK